MVLRAFGLLFFVVALIGAMAAQAATINPEAGVVLVNKGDGFVPIFGQAQLAPGTQVMVHKDGVATIAYAGDCRVRVGSGLWVVQATTPCTGGKTEIDFTGKMSDGSLKDDQPPPPPRDPIRPIVIGGGIVILSCLVWWCRDHDRPASP
jgi:hypothetical protein